MIKESRRWMPRVHCQVVDGNVGCQRFALQMKNKGSVVGVSVGHFRRISCPTVGKDLMCSPSRVGVVQDVPNGGIHISENKFAIGSVEQNQELVLLEKDGPSGAESSDNQVIQLLYRMPRSIVGVDDLVQKKQSRVVIVGKMSSHLRGENVTIGVHHGQVLHRFQVNLNDDGPIDSCPIL